jgi:hypothetical protein
MPVNTNPTARTVKLGRRRKKRKEARINNMGTIQLAGRSRRGDVEGKTAASPSLLSRCMLSVPTATTMSKTKRINQAAETLASKPRGKEIGKVRA